jgi:hypothetical protein
VRGHGKVAEGNKKPRFFVFAARRMVEKYQKSESWQMDLRIRREHEKNIIETMTRADVRTSPDRNNALGILTQVQPKPSRTSVSPTTEPVSSRTYPI